MTDPVDTFSLPPISADPPDRDDRGTDEMTIVIAPGEAAEVKLYMGKDDVAGFEWTAMPGYFNSTLHGNDNGTGSESDG